MIWAILGVALCLYLPFLSAPFHYDDYHSVVWNPAIKSWDNLWRVLIDPTVFSSDPNKVMYRPMLLVSYLVSSFTGTSPESYRLGNLFLHLQAGAMVYLLGRWLVSRRAAKWAAALFLLHPVFSEPYFYISSRSESLMTVYACTALWMFARNWHLGAFCFAVLAILIKETAVVLLPMFLWYDHVMGYQGKYAPIRFSELATTLFAGAWHGERMSVGVQYRYGRVCSSTALALFTAAYLWFSWYAGILAGSGTRAGRPWAAHFWTQAAAIRDYTLAFLWPVNWGIEGSATAQTGFSWIAATSLLLVAASGLWAWQHHNRTVKFLWGAFWLAFLPTLIIPLNILMVERRLYWPGVFLCIGVSMLAAKQERRFGKVGIMAMLAILGVLALLTFGRGGVWSDPAKLWRQSAEVAPPTFRTMMNYGTEMVRAGEYGEARKALTRAQAMASGPEEQSMALGNLGSYHFTTGNFDTAFIYYVEAIQLDTMSADLWANIGVLWFEMGKKSPTAEDRAVRWQGALAYLTHALKLNPGHRQAQLGLGNLYGALGMKDEAEEVQRKLKQARDTQVLIPYTGDRQ